MKIAAGFRIEISGSTMGQSANDQKSLVHCDE